MQTPTITREDFLKLGQGDVILWNRKYHRTVLEGPRDRPGWKALSVDLLIRHRSWTGRITTVRCYHDIKHLIQYTGKRTRQLFNLGELSRLSDAGFDILAGVEKEMARFDEGLRPQYWPCGPTLAEVVMANNPGFCKRIAMSRRLLTEALAL